MLYARLFETTYVGENAEYFYNKQLNLYVGSQLYFTITLDKY